MDADSRAQYPRNTNRLQTEKFCIITVDETPQELPPLPRPPSADTRADGQARTRENIHRPSDRLTAKKQAASFDAEKNIITKAG